MRRLDVHRFEVRSQDEEDLRDRLEAFGRAVFARGGSIVDITWAAEPTDGDWFVTVVYKMPSEEMPDDISSISTGGSSW